VITLALLVVCRIRSSTELVDLMQPPHAVEFLLHCLVHCSVFAFVCITCLNQFMPQIDFCQVSFFRSVDALNDFPAALLSVASLPSFKRSLKQIDLTEFSEGSHIFQTS
jgi:hypothetical protein